MFGKNKVSQEEILVQKKLGIIQAIEKIFPVAGGIVNYVRNHDHVNILIEIFQNTEKKIQEGHWTEAKNHINMVLKQLGYPVNFENQEKFLKLILVNSEGFINFLRSQ